MEVRLPRLGEGADSGSVAAIFVKVGETVKKDQPIIELESEKAVASIPSPASGTVRKIHVKEGDEIKVGQAILTISEDGEAESSKPAKQKQSAEEAAIPVEAKPSVQEPASPAKPSPRVSGFPPPASPSVRKMARELGIDLNLVQGSERGGRIVLADVRRYVQRLQQPGSGPSAVSSPPALSKPVAPQVDFSKWGPVTKQKMTQLRKAISKKMTESWTTIPHITQFADADITALMDLRKKYAPVYEKKKARLTLTGFVVKSTVDVLKKHPKFNCSIDELTEELVFKNYYHIGIAVDTDQGLIVPVMRDVDKKDLLTISLELEQLADRTRERQLAMEEMQGGTFTISNQGGIGGTHFTPIINKPEVAILGVGQGRWQPVPNGKKSERRLVLPLGLSYDHRAIDGADAARFVADLVAALEKFRESDAALKPAAKKGKK